MSTPNPKSKADDGPTTIERTGTDISLNGSSDTTVIESLTTTQIQIQNSDSERSHSDSIPVSLSTSADNSALSPPLEKTSPNPPIKTIKKPELQINGESSSREGVREAHQQPIDQQFSSLHIHNAHYIHPPFSKDMQIVNSERLKAFLDENPQIDTEREILLKTNQVQLHNVSFIHKKKGLRKAVLGEAGLGVGRPGVIFCTNYRIYFSAGTAIRHYLTSSKVVQGSQNVEFRYISSITSETIGVFKTPTAIALVIRSPQELEGEDLPQNLGWSPGERLLFTFRNKETRNLWCSLLQRIHKSIHTTAVSHYNTTLEILEERKLAQSQKNSSIFDSFMKSDDKSSTPSPALTHASTMPPKYFNTHLSTTSGNNLSLDENLIYPATPDLGSLDSHMGSSEISNAVSTPISHVSIDKSLALSDDNGNGTNTPLTSSAPHSERTSPSHIDSASSLAVNEEISETTGIDSYPEVTDTEGGHHESEERNRSYSIPSKSETNQPVEKSSSSSYLLSSAKLLRPKSTSFSNSNKSPRSGHKSKTFGKKPSKDESSFSFSLKKRRKSNPIDPDDDSSSVIGGSESLDLEIFEKEQFDSDSKTKTKTKTKTSSIEEQQSSIEEQEQKNFNSESDVTPSSTPLSVTPSLDNQHTSKPHPRDNQSQKWPLSFGISIRTPTKSVTPPNNNQNPEFNDNPSSIQETTESESSTPKHTKSAMSAAMSKLKFKKSSTPTTASSTNILRSISKKPKPSSPVKPLNQPDKRSFWDSIAIKYRRTQDSFSHASTTSHDSGYKSPRPPTDGTQSILWDPHQSTQSLNGMETVSVGSGRSYPIEFVAHNDHGDIDSSETLVTEELFFTFLNLSKPWLTLITIILSPLITPQKSKYPPLNLVVLTFLLFILGYYDPPVSPGAIFLTFISLYFYSLFFIPILNPITDPAIVLSGWTRLHFSRPELKFILYSFGFSTFLSWFVPFSWVIVLFVWFPRIFQMYRMHHRQTHRPM